jgi:tetratricopeptide (TPR) repeat protein
LEGIGYAQFLAGEEEQAKATFEECLRLQRAGGDPVAINRASVGLAQVLVALSEVEAARPMSEEIVRFSEAHNDKTSEHFGWHFLADCALIEGRCTESLECYKRSLIVAQELGDQIETSFEVQGVAMSLAGLGLAKSPLGITEVTEGVLLAEAAKAEWDRIGADIHIRFWDALLDRYIGAGRKALPERTLIDTINKGYSLSFDAAVKRALKVSPGDSA